MNTAVESSLENLRDQTKTHGFDGQSYYYGESVREAFLVVRKIPTAGGVQYCVKTIHFGNEGSGAYFQNFEDCLKCVESRLEHVHRPMIASGILKKRLEKLQSDLSWIVSSDEPVTKTYPDVTIPGISEDDICDITLT